MIQRVSAAPGETGLTTEECRPVDGVYRTTSQGTKSRGVQVRYQYEIVHDGEPLELIVQALESRITEALVPVFFEGCSDRPWEDAVFTRRGLRGGEPQMMLEGVIVGIDSAPVDFASGQECIANNLDQTTSCHRMEGALTLYFPPNADVSSHLPSATLSALQTIAINMMDGTLAASHPDVGVLFLEDSYGLAPVLPEGTVAPERTVALEGTVVATATTPRQTADGVYNYSAVTVFLALLGSLLALFGLAYVLLVALKRRRERDSTNEKPPRSASNREGSGGARDGGDSISTRGSGSGTRDVAPGCDGAHRLSAVREVSESSLREEEEEECRRHRDCSYGNPVSTCEGYTQDRMAYWAQGNEQRGCHREWDNFHGNEEYRSNESAATGSSAAAPGHYCSDSSEYRCKDPRAVRGSFPAPGVPEGDDGRARVAVRDPPVMDYNPSLGALFGSRQSWNRTSGGRAGTVPRDRGVVACSPSFAARPGSYEYWCQTG